MTRVITEDIYGVPKLYKIATNSNFTIPVRFSNLRKGCEKSFSSMQGKRLRTTIQQEHTSNLLILNVEEI